VQIRFRGEGIGEERIRVHLALGGEVGWTFRRTS